MAMITQEPKKIKKYEVIRPRSLGYDWPIVIVYAIILLLLIGVSVAICVCFCDKQEDQEKETPMTVEK